MTVELNADYVELASTQYYGWLRVNVDYLLPTRQQLANAERVVREYQEKMKGKSRIIYVIPDYFEKRLKPCMNGWGAIFLTIAPDGSALPCHVAKPKENRLTSSKIFFHIDTPCTFMPRAVFILSCISALSLMNRVLAVPIVFLPLRLIKLLSKGL